jgi:hypothetical protein
VKVEATYPELPEVPVLVSLISELNASIVVVAFDFVVLE